jgi:hypothetical protein
MKRNYRLLFGPLAAAILGFVFALGTAAGQTAAWTLNPNEPLEKYDNPPAYIYWLETSPRMVSPYGAFISYQVNVDANGNNIVGDAANEPSIAVDPTDGNRMTIGWRQFNTVTSNFRQGGWGFTTDGGIHWTFPGVLENNVFRSDPVLNSNETGSFFYLSLLQSFCDNIWRSTNGGQSWTELQADGAAGGGDKEWFTIDKTGGMGHGFQYQAWSSAATCDGGQFSRSTDGGITWMNPIAIPNSAIWGTLDVATNGNLFIGGGDGGSGFWCIRSSNAQDPGVTPMFDQVTTVNLGGSLVGGSINPEGLTGQIFLWVDRSGGPTNNNIYMLASVRPPSYSNGTDVMFVRSTDGGFTFSAPNRINDDATQNKWHWFGTFAVAPNGRLDAVWYDTRNAANNTDSQLFYSYSTDGGITWAANFAVSAAFNPLEGWPQQNKIGDYITIASDNTGGNVAYSATFNFNPSRGQHEEDIYYVRVSPSHPAFFNGETALGSGWYYLQFANGTPFGYYSYLADPHFIYHIDLGLEYLFDANDANHGIYFYDFASSSFFYTSPSTFPYLYDFSLNAWLYYLPDVNNPGRYTHNPRWFFNFATGQWITL